MDTIAGTDSMMVRVVAYSSWAMIITGVVIVLASMLISAPYGRYSTSKGWGPLIPAKLAWILMESPNLWVSCVTYLVMISYGTFTINMGVPGAPITSLEETLHSKPVANWILIIMYLSHYFHRSIIFPLQMKQCNDMPISIMFLAFTFCCWNGFNQAMSLLLLNNEQYAGGWIQEPRFVIGVAIFVIGMGINMQSDYRLLSLREGSSSKGANGANRGDRDNNGNRATEKKYVIPRGGMFEFVSCANYFGEILEWTGFALACWSLPAAAFAWYTFSNLAPRAIKHHEWYQQKFEDYPKHRTAVIPFLL